MVTLQKEMEYYENMCAERFSTHKATVTTENDRYLIIDWRRKDDSGDYYINFIIDKKRGAFIVTGDLGDSIAVWYNPVTPEKLRDYIFNDVGYYIGKIECASDLYVYDEDDIIADLKEYIDIDAEDAYLETHNEYGNSSELWGDIKDYICDSLYGRDQFIPSDDLREIIKDFDPNYWEWLPNCGKHISGRVFIWAIGFKMAMEQLGR
ncbi:MAG: hypothetical protein K6C13_05995 [Oscillospiraceae bacterium]|nr:hypothetical protein [Oscillospiraceae bacterium]